MKPSVGKPGVLPRAMGLWGMALGVLLTCAEAAQGQEIYSINGQVRDNATNQNLEGARVYLRLGPGRTLTDAYSRSNGDFVFGNVGPGVYYVEMEERDYLPVSVRVEVYNADVSGVLLVLRKPVGSDVTVTTRETSISARELALGEGTRKEWKQGMELLYRKDKPQEALKKFEKVAQEAQKFYDAYFQMGVAQRKLNRPEEAMASYRKSIELSGADGYAEPRFALAGMLDDRRRYAEAAQLASEGLKKEPDSWLGHFELARAQLGLSQLAEAEESARESQLQKPDYPDTYLVLANIYMKTQNLKGLVEVLDEFLRLAPNGPKSGQARRFRDQAQQELAKANGGETPQKPK